MDSNGHRFWSFATPEAFDLSDGSARWNERCLQLAGRADFAEDGGSLAAARAASNLRAVTVGQFGDFAYFDPDQPFEGEAASIVTGTETESPAPRFAVPEEAQLLDMAVDNDGVLRVVGQLTATLSGLFLADARDRWTIPIAVETVGAVPDRVAGRWVLERSTGRLWREAGKPLHQFAQRSYSDHIFRPDPEYTNKVRLKELPPLKHLASESILDCAVRSDGVLAVLIVSASATRRSRVIFHPVKGKPWSLDVPMDGFASSIGFVADDKIALTFPGAKRAMVLDAKGDRPDVLSIRPEQYPLVGDGEKRLCRGVTQPCYVVRYADGTPMKPKALLPLSMPNFGKTGRASGSEPIDSEYPNTVWHRFAVEGDFPAGTGAILTLRVFDDPSAEEEVAGYDHYVGQVAVPKGAPSLGFIDDPSEIPLHPGVLGRGQRKDQTGCFTGLIQQDDTVSREMVGRYASLRIRLIGNGQSTPSIAAIRVYGGRFSLVKNYLPAVLQPLPDPALRVAPGDAHPLDFYDRHVAGYEQLLTRLEDKVVAAPSLTNPYAAPPEALDWLAGWIGLSLRPGFSEDKRRAMLANGMRLHRRRGTLNGLKLALDIASDGEVTKGGIVALEDFRLRRVFATILGADLGVQYDPLLAGPVESGNSFVGPTLHLGDMHELDEDDAPTLSKNQLTEIAALYSAPTDAAERQAVESFFAELAWRITVLVHPDIEEAEIGVLRDVADQMVPAHIKLRVERATKPLIIGLYSLLGIDTYLRPRAQPSPVTLTPDAVVGEKDQIISLPSFDPSIDYGDQP